MPEPLSPLSSLFGRRGPKRNVAAMLRFVAILATVVLLYSILFHVIMAHEGQEYSWLTSVYWTVSTMTTLGLGDIVFTTDLGRMFTTVVLSSGILLLLVVLPFSFIQWVYAPWLAARPISERLANHVVITTWDALARELAEKLALTRIPFVVVEPDASKLSELDADVTTVLSAPIDDRRTYERLHTARARLVVANAGDTTNANIVLTVREVAPNVPIASIADREASVDILELAGSTNVLPLRRRLGEQLAQRVNVGHAQAHVVGSFGDLSIAEFSIHASPFVGRTLQDIGFRETLGINVVGYFEHTEFHPVGPNTVLGPNAILVVAAKPANLEELDEVLWIYDVNPKPVLVLGGGAVGRAATGALRRRGTTVHMVERDPALTRTIGTLPDKLIIGDAAERDVLTEGGLDDAPAVLITTNDDAMNIYLTAYCRRLVPEIHIVSRITHERNMAAIRRAGADIALSHITLGVESLISILQGRGLVYLGEGIALHELAVPKRLAGRTLAETDIASRTGLSVIGIRQDGQVISDLSSQTTLPEDGTIAVIGTEDQVREFAGVSETS